MSPSPIRASLRPSQRLSILSPYHSRPSAGSSLRLPTCPSFLVPVCPGTTPDHLWAFLSAYAPHLPLSVSCLSVFLSIHEFLSSPSASNCLHPFLSSFEPYLSTHLSICMPVYPPTCTSLCLTCSSMCLGCRSFCPSTRPFRRCVHLSVPAPVYPCPSLALFVSIPEPCLSVPCIPSVHPCALPFCLSLTFISPSSSPPCTLALTHSLCSSHPGTQVWTPQDLCPGCPLCMDYAS